MSLLVASLVTLGVIGCVAAIVLYFVATKFKVEEDVRIDEVEAALPGANCGGCGYPGCRGFASACVGAESLDGKFCPVGGQPVMDKVAEILGLEAGSATPKVAVLRCNGSCSNRPKTTNFDGVKNCKIVAMLYAGETGCSFGCTGFGDCVDACAFDAIHINPETGLPEVDDDKCTACGKCVKACPKNLIELRNKGPKNRRVYVACNNKDKGGVARKACSAACIGCGKCAKACPFGAITIEDNLAYINFELCRLCRKCVAECPTGAIHAVNFPTPPPAQVKKTEEPAERKVIDCTKTEIKPQPAVIEHKPVAEETEISIVKPVEDEPVITIEIKPQNEPETIPDAVVKPDTVADDVRNMEPEVEPKTISDVRKENVDIKQDVGEISEPMLVIPEDVDINTLIDPSLKVTPREKKRDDAKIKNDKPDNDGRSLFDMD